MIVVPQLSFHGSRIAMGEELPPVREGRMLASMGASELSLHDLDGAIAQGEALPSWTGTLVAVTALPVRLDARLHDGAAIERAVRGGFSSIVVDHRAVHDPLLLRWALDLVGTRLVVEVQVDGEYLFDPPPAAFDRSVFDVLGYLHLQGVRRILLRDVTADEVEVGQLLAVGDRLPSTRITYQGPVRGLDDIAALAAVGRPIEAVLVDARRVFDGTIDLPEANRAAGSAGGGS